MYLLFSVLWRPPLDMFDEVVIKMSSQGGSEGARSLELSVAAGCCERQWATRYTRSCAQKLLAAGMRNFYTFCLKVQKVISCLFYKDGKLLWRADFISVKLPSLLQSSGVFRTLFCCLGKGSCSLFSWRHTALKERTEARERRKMWVQTKQLWKNHRDKASWGRADITIQTTKKRGFMSSKKRTFVPPTHPGLCGCDAGSVHAQRGLLGVLGYAIPGWKVRPRWWRVGRQRDRGWTRMLSWKQKKQMFMILQTQAITWKLLVCSLTHLNYTKPQKRRYHGQQNKEIESDETWKLSGL